LGEEKVSAMNAEAKAPGKLPFGLKTLDGVVISYEVQAGKSGAGREAIRIEGSGDVVLLRTESADAQPQTLSGKVSPDAVARLLELFASARFTALDASYEGTGPLQGSRSVTIRAGATQHAVVMIGGGTFRANEFVGAIKVVAGLAVPAATEGTFFRYM
jgi:hypothetical protein